MSDDRCPSCGGIWFWSMFSIGYSQCVECEPPESPEEIKRGPGIIQPDGSILTSESISSDIADVNRRYHVAAAMEDLGTRWKPTSMKISTTPAIGDQEFTTLSGGPSEIDPVIVMNPGDPGWVSRKAEQSAIDAHAARVASSTLAKPKMTTTSKSEVAVKQGLRKQRAPKRKVLAKEYPTDASENSSV